MKISFLISCIALFFVIFLSGCNSAGDLVDDDFALSDTSLQTEIESNLSIKSSIPLFPMNELQQNRSHFTDKYYIDFSYTNSDGEDVPNQSVVAFNLENAEKAAESELIAGIIYADNKFDTKARNLLILFEDSKQNLHLTKYDYNGLKVSDDNMVDSTIIHNSPLQIFEADSDKYYVLLEQQLLIIDTTGEIESRIECPRKRFASMYRLSDDRIFITYTDNRKNFIALFNTQKGSFENEIELKTDIYTSGMSDKDTIMFVKNNIIYEYSPSIDCYVPIVSTTDNSIKSTNISNIAYINGTLYVTDTKAIDDKAWLMLTEFAQGSDNSTISSGDSKEIITVFMPKYKFPTAAIDEFELNYPQYKIEVMSPSLNPQTALVSDNPPDVYFPADDYQISTLAQKGMLEDLKPYIEQSDRLTYDGLNNAMISAYSIGDKLYALSESYSYTIQCAPADAIVPATPVEYLQWLDDYMSNNNVLSSSPTTLVYMGLSSGISEFVDFDSKQANINCDKFKELLNCMKAVHDHHPGNDFRHYENGQICRTVEGWFVSSLYSIAELRQLYDIVPIGYPSYDNVMRYYYYVGNPMAILSSSQHKEGAYEFVEFMMYLKTYFGNPTHSFLNINELNSIDEIVGTVSVEENANPDLGYFQALPYGMDSADYNNYVSIYLEEADIEIFNHLSDNIFIETYERKTAMDIIVEETAPFFDGKKNIDEVCEVIQNRISLMLNEQK